MKKQVLSVAILGLLALFSFAPRSANAQWVGYFSNGAFTLGPEIGLPLGFADGGVLLGGHGEVALTNAGTLGSGRLALEFGLDYWSASGDGFTVTILPIHGAFNYHFAIPNNRTVDPFIGLGLGYAIVSVSGGGTGNVGGSALYFVYDGGVRYWFSPTVAGRAEIAGGFGGAELFLGVDFELN